MVSAARPPRRRPPKAFRHQDPTELDMGNSVGSKLWMGERRGVSPPVLMRFQPAGLRRAARHYLRYIVASAEPAARRLQPLKHRIRAASPREPWAVRWPEPPRARSASRPSGFLFTANYLGIVCRSPRFLFHDTRGAGVNPAQAIRCGTLAHPKPVLSPRA